MLLATEHTLHSGYRLSDLQHTLRMSARSHTDKTIYAGIFLQLCRVLWIFCIFAHISSCNKWSHTVSHKKIRKIRTCPFYASGHTMNICCHRLTGIISIHVTHLRFISGCQSMPQMIISAYQNSSGSHKSCKMVITFHILYHTMRDLKHRLDLTLWNPDNDM